MKAQRKPRRTFAIGQKYKMLTVVGLSKGKYGLVARCQCECGNYSNVLIGNLGKTRGCGCVKGKGATTHGRTHSREFSSWHAMRQRCLNPHVFGYKRYGGRGISVCDRWLNSFENFFADMGERPAGKTLERIENDLGYSPNNCRWATHKEQSANTSRSHWLTFAGKTMILSDWSRELGISRSVLSLRAKRNLPAEEILRVLTDEERGARRRWRTYRLNNSNQSEANSYVQTQ